MGEQLTERLKRDIFPDATPLGVRTSLQALLNSKKRIICDGAVLKL